MARYLDATNDVAFKKIFQNEDRLKAFLNVTLRLKAGAYIQKITLLPANEIPDIGQGKESLFDLKCTDEAGNIFVVEMQNCREGHFLKRAQYYGAKTYASQLKRGDDYEPQEKQEEEPTLDNAERHKGLVPVVVVAVSANRLFPKHIDCISFHRTLEDKTKEQHLFALTYVFIELPKFTKSDTALETVEDEWLHFLKYAKKDQAPPSTITDRHVLDAYGALERFNWTALEFDAYDRARLRREIAEDNLVESYQEGVEEGIEKGERQKAITVAKTCFQQGLSIEITSILTGLSAEELQRLQKE